MAQATFDHVEAPGKVYLHGVLAFTKGDPIPVATAKEYGIEGKTVKANEDVPEGRFTDAPLAVVQDDTGTDTGKAKK